MYPATDTSRATLRSPDTVMKLARMGAFHQTRLSFMRALLRQLKRDAWTFHRVTWKVDDRGVGVAVYEARGPDNTYSLVCFAHDLPPEKRSDRVIAEAWDATFTLFDGIPDEADIARLAANVPLQEAGNCAETELVLARANRSVRLFEHVVGRLSRGEQPDPAEVESVGYLMRTTAVYGNGKFGLGDRERIAARPEFHGAFRAELLAVWLIRWFTVDIAEHLARVRNPVGAAAMNPAIRQRLGVGNSTGLGMAPFLGTHPALLHCWILARETALARVRAAGHPARRRLDHFLDVFARSRIGVADWRTGDARQASRIEGLKADLDKLEGRLSDGVLDAPFPWDALIRWSADALTIEGQELLVSLVIEPHGDLVDDLADTMAVDEQPLMNIDGAMTIGEALDILQSRYDWALETDFDTREASARFWYVSEEKLEPRLGERFDEPGAEKEQPLAFGRDMCRLHDALRAEPASTLLAAFLMRRPEFRGEVRRLQTVARLPYAEIRDNLIDAALVPVDLLRCKLSFFGATRFDPRSDRWVRITMFQDAPYPDDFRDALVDDWVYPRK